MHSRFIFDSSRQISENVNYLLFFYKVTKLRNIAMCDKEISFQVLVVFQIKRMRNKSEHLISYDMKSSLFAKCIQMESKIYKYSITDCEIN